jgi:hypothetical protein
VQMRTYCIWMRSLPGPVRDNQRRGRLTEGGRPWAEGAYLP